MMLITYISVGLNLVLISYIACNKVLNSSKISEEELSANNQIMKSLIEFLEKADDAYITTNQTNRNSPFCEFATNRVCNDVMDVIRSSPPKLFGTKAYRNRKWTFIGEEGNRIKVRKDITYKNIEVKKGIQISIGDNLQEYWTVLRMGDNYVVEDLV